MPLKALIFDVDGTIASTEKYGHLTAFNKAFKLFNLDWHWSYEEYEKLLEINGGRERIAYYASEYKYLTNTTLNKKDVAKLHDLKTAIFIECVNKNLAPIRTGIERIINESYENGLKLAIATTTNIKNVEAILATARDKDILKKFNIIATGDTVKNKKPAPDIYAYTLDKLNLSASECIAFEDSAIGLKAANAIGIKTLITISEFTAKNNFDGAMLVLNNLGDKNKPFKIIKGDYTNHSYVSLNYLQELYKINT